MNISNRIDLEMARDFIVAIKGAESERCIFQTLPDSGNERPKSFSGTLAESLPTIQAAQQLGLGIAVAIHCHDDSMNRKNENITGMSAVIVDADNGIKPEIPIIPSCVVETKNGFHFYFLIIENDRNQIERIRRLGKKIAAILGTDPSVTDPSRVMRLPGTIHQKDPNDPFLVKTLEINRVCYSLDELEQAFDVKQEDNCVDLDEFEKNLSAKKGNRNNNCYILACKALELGTSTIKTLELIERFCIRSGLPLVEGKHAFESAQKKQADELFKSKRALNRREVAILFLNQYRNANGELLIRNWADDYYLYKDNEWTQLEPKEMQVLITRFISKIEELKKEKIKSYVQDILMYVFAETHLKRCDKNSFWIDDPLRQGHWIVLGNGILDIDRCFRRDPNFLIAHTPQFFSTNKMGINYSPFADCPTWKKVLSDSLVNQERIDLFQEWCGYNLIPDTRQQKFVIMVGEGANGKSVLITVLTGLVGIKNVSHVGLEAFSQGRTFMLAGMMGKLANIVSELNEMDKAAEGNIKSHVTGERVTYERKNRDPFETIPTARLTFATNVLPRLKSSATGRRLILFKFENQILDEAKQDKRLTDLQFWIKSGELDGIFLWALEGLQRLLDRGHFQIPEVIKTAVADYIQDSNPAWEFLNTYCEYIQGEKISKQEAYQNYSVWSESHGYTPLNESNFAKEVRKKFPKVEASKGIVALNSAPKADRKRVWYHLRVNS